MRKVLECGLKSVCVYIYLIDNLAIVNIVKEDVEGHIIRGIVTRLFILVLDSG